MSRRATNNPKYEIYPKRYFDASPTWFAWNNLTAADVQTLRTEPGFEGQKIFFHLNHPIRFVRLVGLVVDVTVTTSGKYILISLDDSSGACIEIKTFFRPISKEDHAEYPSNTVVDNLDVLLEFGVPAVFINGQRIEIGAVIKAKGTLDSFRNTRQINLERIWAVKDTNEEVKAWSETAQWKQDVLSTPWILTRQRRSEIDEELRQDELKRRERSKEKRSFDAAQCDKKKKRQEKDELRRRQAEQKYNDGALPGSCVLPTRITDS